MDSATEKRMKEIQKAVTESPVPQSDTDRYMTQVVCSLLEEGNVSFKGKDWSRAIQDFTKGLNIAQYAASEKMDIPKVLLESLFVNRATAYHSLGMHQLGVQDCDQALHMNRESNTALYRKALCLKELGQYQMAYDCTTECLMITRLDHRVNELAQELAVYLGLRNRKPYVSAEGGLLGPYSSHDAAAFAPSTSLSSVTTCDSHVTPAAAPHHAYDSFIPRGAQAATPSAAEPDELDDSELMGEDWDTLLDCIANESESTETHIHAALPAPPLSARVHADPVVLPAPTPQLPPAFFSPTGTPLSPGGGGGGPDHRTFLDFLNRLDALDVLDGVAAQSAEPLDDLDRLDSLDDLLESAPVQGQHGDLGAPWDHTETNRLDASLDDYLDNLESVSSPAFPSGEVLNMGANALGPLDSLDALDSFSPPEEYSYKPGDYGITPSYSVAVPAKHSVKKIPKTQHDSERSRAAANPLSSSHEFLQACSLCFPREGISIYTFVHKPDLVHNCQRDILLCRKKLDQQWTRIRPLPITKSLTAPFVLCRELLNSGDVGLCKYEEKCTFAFNQLEIDVWTKERMGSLDRKLMFGRAVKVDPAVGVVQLLEEHKGMYMFLCEKCYDSKPSITSKRSKEDRSACSNLRARHVFDTNKCLAYVVWPGNVSYRKIRPFNDQCYVEMCRHAVRYGCQLEDGCLFSHSPIELKTWELQRDTGITAEEIVEESIKYYGNQDTKRQNNNKPLSSGGAGDVTKSKGGGGGGGRGGSQSFIMRLKFICAQCWQNGLISEPDKTLKYCTAKARHSWVKERRVLLVKSLERNKWVQVRPLPFSKNHPLQYDICAQILEKRKCNYTGNCTFAHSQEEKELWTYMKNSDMKDIQQIYDKWLSLTRPSRPTNGAMLNHPVPAPSEEKNIVMPTDFAEPMVRKMKSGFFCRLCGRHSNSERQWRKHISTERHKDRVFICEAEEQTLTWNHRFPGLCFKICPKLDSECPEGLSCDYAHSPEELQEWLERRDYLRRKLARARNDMLIMPDEVDFGKYNFLLQD